MHILHLSDLHFGTIENANNWFNQITGDLIYELSCQKLDAMILSGDIVNTSVPEEYGAARQFLEELSKKFKLGASQIIIVPGNHDLNWTLSKNGYTLMDLEDYEGDLEGGYFIKVSNDVIRVRNEKEYKKRFEHFSRFYQDVKGKPYPLEYKEQGTIDFFEDHNLLILGLNSAWQLDYHFASRADICSAALSTALGKILKPEYSNCLKFAVWHHPLASPFEDRIKDHAFMQRLSQAGFCLALHGHIHKADNALYRYDHSVGGRRIEIVGTGTFGSPMREWVPGYPLQYNLLKLVGNRLTVETRCRKEINGAWKPDAIWTQGPGKDPLPRYEIFLPNVISNASAQSANPSEIFLHKPLNESVSVREIVDFDDDFETFKAMLTGQDTKHLMFITAPRGRGKTCLLKKMRDCCEKKRIPCSWIDFQKGAYDTPHLTLAQEICEQLDIPLKPLADALRPLISNKFAGKASTVIEGNVTDSQIITTVVADDSLNNAELLNKTHIKQRLMRAFVDAIKLVDSQMVVFMDNLDYISQDNEDWIVDALFHQMREGKLGKIIIISAGQRWPRFEYLRWKQYAHFVEGLPRMKKEHFIEYAERIGSPLSEGEADFCWAKSEKGLPNMMGMLIKDLRT